MIHASHWPEMRQALPWVGGLGLMMVLVLGTPLGSITQGLSQNLTLHLVFEITAVVVAALVFASAWHAPLTVIPGSVVILSTAFLGVGLLDLSHMLAFQGMPDYLGPSDPEKAISFWLAARLLAVLALIAVAFRPWMAPAALPRRAMLALVLVLVAAFHGLVLLAPEMLPRTFVPGQGLTPFKVGFEWLLVGLSVLALLGLLRHLAQPRSFHAAGLSAAVVLTGMSEIFFTLYSAVFDVYNLLGHLYKIVAYVFLYKAVVVETITLPYARLSLGQARQQALLDLHQIADHVSEQEFMQRGIEHAERLTRSHIAFIHFVNDDQETIELVTWSRGTLADYCRASHDSHYPVSKAGIWADALRQRQPVIINDYATASGKRGLPDGHAALHRLISLPVIDSGKVRMMAGVGNKTHLYDHDDIETVQLIANTIWRIARQRRAETIVRANEQQIRHLSLHDQLTGLPNRDLLRRQGEQMLGMAARRSQNTAVLFIDVDHFKSVNESLGHAAGDVLLREIAKRLNTEIGTDDLLARVSGDEFAIVLADTDSAGAGRAALRLLSVLSEPFDTDTRRVGLTASIGVAMSPTDATTFEDLLQAADNAAHQVKSEGRNNYRFYAADMQARADRQLRLSYDMRDAHERGEFHLVYQPQVSLLNGRLIGVEALLRWQHPELGALSPTEFVPIAEDNGMIVPIGEWVLRTALQQLASWQADGVPIPLVAVNLSAVQFLRADLLERIQMLLRESQVMPHCLELELTEAVAMHDPDQAAGIMSALHATGVRLSIDDFGTGYSSLSQLRRFKVYKLKIDQSFVRNLAHDANDQAIVRAVVQMASTLGMQTIAEGVETPEQAAVLAGLQCSEAQGFLYSRPLTPENVVRFARQGQS